MIELRAVSFRYGEKKPIFEGFDWCVEAGEAWAVLGPSGCGKSTLLYLLAGLRHPQSGQIIISDNGAGLTCNKCGTIYLKKYKKERLVGWAAIPGEGD